MHEDEVVRRDVHREVGVGQGTKEKGPVQVEITAGLLPKVLYHEMNFSL